MQSADVAVTAEYALSCFHEMLSQDSAQDREKILKASTAETLRHIAPWPTLVSKARDGAVV